MLYTALEYYVIMTEPISEKATPLANSDADKYAAEKEKATARFKEALGYLEEAAKVSPDNANVKKMIPQVQDAMK